MPRTRIEPFWFFALLLLAACGLPKKPIHDAATSMDLQGELAEEFLKSCKENDQAACEQVANKLQQIRSTAAELKATATP